MDLCFSDAAVCLPPAVVFCRLLPCTGAHPGIRLTDPLVRGDAPVIAPVTDADGRGGTVVAWEWYASCAVQFHPNGSQFDFARSPARTPHGAYV